MTTKEARLILDGHDDMTIASLAAGFIHRTVMHDALVAAGLATGRISSIQEMDAANPIPSLPRLDLRLCDCMDLMREFPDKHFELAIVDPPYGIGVGDNKQGMGRRKGDARATYKMGDWDHEAPPVEYFAELRRVSKHQIVWGANHFIERLSINSACWIVWDKMFSNDVSFAAVELAWTSFDATAKKFQRHPLQADRIHPTQKPVALYKWLLANYAKPGDRILDTHLGSGSSAIACHYAGHHLTAAEIDPDYYAAALERVERETRQLDFLTP